MYDWLYLDNKLQYSILEKVIRECKFENEDLDFKLTFSKEKKSKIELAKDIMSFANADGGYLIFGIDKNFNQIGLDNELLIDEADVRNTIKTYLDGKISLGIREIWVRINDTSKKFYAIYICPSEDIIVAKRSGSYGNNQEHSCNKQK